MSASRFDEYQSWRCLLDDPVVELDLSHSGLSRQDLADRRSALERALAAMAELESGAIANPDEQRMVGHYWLRSPGVAPEGTIQDSIVEVVVAVEEFARQVHAGEVAPKEGGRFRQVLVCGIGGSALGPMLVADVFDAPQAPMGVRVLDNTDPEGIARVLAELGSLRDVLVLVISKSGGTPETRNSMLEVMHACRRESLDFPSRAVAITGVGSELDRRATEEGWLSRFPMWDWVGGRTSVFSVVGLLPAALQGVDVRGLLAGAAAMDASTREPDPSRNPAALLALFWHVESGGSGSRDMVVLPYRDRLLLFSRYLQQLVMESLGKSENRRGAAVHQGLSVYGNKGSTDQHAFVQQLRDGLHNFFVVFVRVLVDGVEEDVLVDEGTTSGDYLDGFWQGTRAALLEGGRHSATITLEQLDERSLAALIALFERAVGIYAELIDVNAYHQPGVEAGKTAAARVLELQAQVLIELDDKPRTAEEIAAALGADPLDVWPVLCHLAANRDGIHGGGILDPARSQFRRV